MSRQDGLSPPERVLNIPDYAEVHRNLLQRYELFLSGLTFAILGLALQTANIVNAVCFIVIFELLSWALLLIAAFCNIWRLDRIVEFFRLVASDPDSLGKKRKGFNKLLHILYIIRNITFICGIISLAISRGSAAFY